MCKKSTVSCLTVFLVYFCAAAWAQESSPIDEPIVPDLINALGGADKDARKDAAVALGKIGTPAKEAIPALISALGDSHESVRISAAVALGKIGTPAKEAIPALISALGDSHESVRINAAMALGHIGEAAKESVPALITVLGDAHVIARATAAMALGKIGKPAKEAVPALISALADPHKGCCIDSTWVCIDVPSMAILALRRIGTPEAVSAVESNLQEVDEFDSFELGQVYVEADRVLFVSFSFRIVRGTNPRGGPGTQEISATDRNLFCDVVSYARP